MRAFALAIVLLTPSLAAANADCTALQAEVEALRARVQVLEAKADETALTPLPSLQSVLPGAAAKPAATATVVVEEPYSRTGCSRGLFKGIEPARWQDPDLWLDLKKGQTPAEVEQQLGVEHYDEHDGNKVIWHYGKCELRSKAQVLFVDGKLMDWRVPAQRPARNYGD